MERKPESLDLLKGLVTADPDTEYMRGWAHHAPGNFILTKRTGTRADYQSPCRETETCDRGPFRLIINMTCLGASYSGRLLFYSGEMI